MNPDMLTSTKKLFLIPTLYLNNNPINSILPLRISELPQIKLFQGKPCKQCYLIYLLQFKVIKLPLSTIPFETHRLLVISLYGSISGDLKSKIKCLINCFVGFSLESQERLLSPTSIYFSHQT